MRFAVVMPLLALAGCSEPEVPAGPVQNDAQAVAMVEDANDVIPPMVPLVPDPVLATDLEAQDMFNAACTYSAATSQGVLVVVRPSDAFMKLDGEIVRFAADPGSRELPGATRSLYNGRAFSLRLEVAEDVGTISLRDAWEREVFSGTGPFRCGT